MEEDEEAIIERRRKERQKLLESLENNNASSNSMDQESSPRAPEEIETFSEDKLVKSVSKPISKSESAVFAGELGKLHW